jgi:hypothetical protein
MSYANKLSSFEHSFFFAPQRRTPCRVTISMAGGAGAPGSTRFQ